MRTYDVTQYNTLYIRQLICHHFIHCPSGSGDDCTQNHCTVLAQTNQALRDIICSCMNVINVIENGGAGNNLHMYGTCHKLLEFFCRNLRFAITEFREC